MAKLCFPAFPFCCEKKVSFRRFVHETWKTVKASRVLRCFPRWNSTEKCRENTQTSPLSLPLFLLLLLSMLFDLVFIHLLFFDLACQRADNEYNMSNIKGNFVSNSPSIPFSTFIKVQYKFWFFCSVYSYGGIRGTYQHFGPQGGQDSGFPSPRSALGYPFPAMHQNSYSGYHLGSYAPPCASPPKDGKCTSYIYITSRSLCV